MRTAEDIILAPVITEASMDGVANKVYTFRVLSCATKAEIAAGNFEKITALCAEARKAAIG